MTSGSKIRHGALWSFMGNTGGQILNFAFGIVLARLLAPEIFGTLLTIQVFTGMASFISGAGMGQALVRAKDTSRSDYDVVFTLQLAVGTLIYGFFYVTAPFIAEWYDTPLYTDLMRVSALSFLFRPFNNVPASILQREMRFQGMAGVSLLALTASNLSCIGLAHADFGVWSLILGGMVSPLVTVPLYARLAGWRPGFSLDYSRAREIARYGMLVSATDILVFLRGRVSTFILSRTLGPAAVGLFNKGESLANMPNGFITGSVYQVLFRSLAAEQENLDKCRYLFFRSIALVAVYGTPFYIGLLWLSEPLIRGLYGARWEEASGPLLILTTAWPFWLVDMLSGAVLAAFAWLHRELLAQTATLVVTSLAILAALEFGINGVAWAGVAASVFSAAYMYALATHCLRARWRDALVSLLPAVILNLILATTLAIASRMLPDWVLAADLPHVLSLAAIGGLVYALSFLYLPIQALASEQQRWKVKLRLQRNPGTATP